MHLIYTDPDGDHDPLPQCSLRAEVNLSPHIWSLSDPGEVIVRASVASTLLDLVPEGCSQRSLLKVLNECEFIYEGPSDSRLILKLGESTAVKVVPNESRVGEYSVLEYLASHWPSLPDPKPLGMLELNEYLMMFMSQIAGAPLQKIWGALEAGQKVAVSAQLDVIFSQLRTHKIPPGRPWGSVRVHGCIDCRQHLRESTAIVHHPQDFGNFILSDRKHGSDIYIDFLQRLHEKTEEDLDPSDCCVFTHDHLRLANIMVGERQDQEIEVAGIVD